MCPGLLQGEFLEQRPEYAGMPFSVGEGYAQIIASVTKAKHVKHRAYMLFEVIRGSFIEDDMRFGEIDSLTRS